MPTNKVVFLTTAALFALSVLGVSSQANFKGPQLLRQGTCNFFNSQGTTTSVFGVPNSVAQNANLSSWTRVAGTIVCGYYRHNYKLCSDFSFGHGAADSIWPDYYQQFPLPDISRGGTPGGTPPPFMELTAAQQVVSDEFSLSLQIVDGAGMVLSTVSSASPSISLSLATDMFNPGTHFVRVRMLCQVGGTYCDAALGTIRVRPASAIPFPFAHTCRDSVDPNADGTEPDGVGGVLSCGCGPGEIGTKCGCVCPTMTASGTCSRGEQSRLAGDLCGIQTNGCGNSVDCNSTCGNPTFLRCNTARLCECNLPCNGRCGTGLIAGNPESYGCPNVCTCTQTGAICNATGYCQVPAPSSSTSAASTTTTTSGGIPSSGSTGGAALSSSGGATSTAAARSSNSASSVSGSSSFPLWIMIVIVVAALVCCVLVVVLVYRRRQRRDTNVGNKDDHIQVIGGTPSDAVASGAYHNLSSLSSVQSEATENPSGSYHNFNLNSIGGAIPGGYDSLDSLARSPTEEPSYQLMPSLQEKPRRF